MATGKQFKIFMIYENNPITLKIQEHSTFIDLVSRFCLLHYQKFLPQRVQGKIQTLLHVFCPVNVYIFHIRIKFLADLLPCEGKHQNSTITGGNNTKLRFQTAFSVTNAQFKYSWVYEADKLFFYVRKYVSDLSFMYARNKHLLSLCDLGKIIHFHLNQLFQSIFEHCIYQRKCNIFFFTFFKICAMEWFLHWWLFLRLLGFSSLEWKRSILRSIKVLDSTFVSSGRDERCLPFSKCLFFLCCFFLPCFDWSFCAFAEPPSLLGLKLTGNCGRDAFKVRAWISVWNGHIQPWEIQHEYCDSRYSTCQTKMRCLSRCCVNILWHCAALK